MLPDRIRTFNKYVTNRITRRFANVSHGPFAIIGHIGRRSGKHYETTIMVRPTREGFLIALTYGPQVDWYRNVLATGGGTIYWHKRLYTVGQPEPMAVQTALSLFPQPEKLILRMLGIQNFVQVKSSGSEPIRA